MRRALNITQAAAYLGMSRRQFSRLVRPHVPSVSPSRRVVLFDRVDLDAWFDREKERCHAATDAHPASRAGAASGGSTKSSLAMADYERARDAIG